MRTMRAKQKHGTNGTFLLCDFYILRTVDYRILLYSLFLKPLSVTNNSVSSRTTTALVATWTTTVAPTLPTGAVRERTLLFVTERGWSQSKGEKYMKSVTLSCNPS